MFNCMGYYFVLGNRVDIRPHQQSLERTHQTRGGDWRAAEVICQEGRAAGAQVGQRENCLAQGDRDPEAREKIGRSGSGNFITMLILPIYNTNNSKYHLIPNIHLLCRNYTIQMFDGTPELCQILISQDTS